MSFLDERLSGILRLVLALPFGLAALGIAVRLTAFLTRTV
jgi:hypothetical protein